MQKQFRLLHLEDDPLDAALIHECLLKEGLRFRIVCANSRETFLEALGESAYDLILSDYSFPGWDGASALKFVKDKHPNIPFIFVSGTMGEDVAIESLVAGATDYVLKQGLKRLAPAVRRALREAKERRERADLEQKFLQAQKMEAVGHLAGGIAHDFNNLLMVILGHVQLLLNRNADAELLASLKNIHQAAEAAGTLTRQLLTISRKQSIHVQILDVSRVITDLGNMLTRIIGENILLETRCSRKALHIQADSGMLEQVLMNLVVNAKDAMPDGGRLTISADEARFHDVQAQAGSGRRGGEFIRLTVSDTGTGIPPEIIPRLFEPFFTTKEPGKGTGLGLATVYGIVQKHQGWIEVDSREGVGTEFVIFLPKYEGHAPLAEANPREAGSAGGAQTILVVEDEPKLRKLVRFMLEEQGFKVLEASSGQDTLALWEKHAHEIDLLLTDLIMPDGISGMELADRLGRLKPGLRVVYTSGYGMDEFEKFSALPGKTVFLQKPYDRRTLIQTVRSCLDGAPG